MFGARYFGARYFGARYFGHQGENPAEVRGIYLGPRYFGTRYWNQRVTSPVNGTFNGRNFFGARYFGARYFGTNVPLSASPFSLTVTNTLAGAGASPLSIPGGFIYNTTWALPVTGTLAAASSAALSTAGLLFSVATDWPFSPPLQGPAGSGVTTVAASFTYGGTFEDFALSVTLGPRATGATAMSTAIELSLRMGLSTLAAAGVTTISLGEFAYGTNTYEFAPSVLSASGSGAFYAAPLYVYEYPIAQVGALAAAAAGVLVGNPVAESTYLFEPRGILSLNIAAYIDGSSLYSFKRDDPTSPYPEDGGPIPTRPRWRRAYAKQWLDLFVNKPPDETPGGAPPVN